MAIKRAEACLANITKHNARVNGFINIRDRTQVLSDANKAGKNGRVIALKDNFCTTDMPTTCGSKMLENYVSPYESTAGRLLRQSGAVIVGKANMDEFAMGTNNDHSYFGPVLNPLYPDEARSPGGSSGGSAAVVGADMCEVALGTDTGGSVRLPAAYCGVVGFKPSYGLISRYGVIAYAQSLDTVGILAKNVGLVEETLGVLSQYDEKDPTSLRTDIRGQLGQAAATRMSTSLTKSAPKLSIGIVAEAIISLSEPVQQAWIDALDYLRTLGHEIKLVSVPSLKNSLPAYFIISPAEASSNLARYDGIRYGYRHDQERDGDNLYAPTRTSGFGSEVQRRILLGTYNLSSGAYGNHFEQAQKVRQKLRSEFDRVFTSPNVLAETQLPASDGVDVIIQPTAQTTAPTLDYIKHHQNPTDAYINDVLTVPASLAGLPAISVPWGEQLVGIQVIGQFGDDNLVLTVAKMLERRREA